MKGDALCINRKYYDKMSDAERRQLFIDKGIWDDWGANNFKDVKYRRTFTQLFLYQLIAANKYNNPNAQAHFGEYFTPFYPGSSRNLDLNVLDADTRKFILDNLWEAYKQDDAYPFAASYLSEYYATGNGVKKDAELSKVLKQRHDSISKAYKSPVYDRKWIKIMIR
ncbi:hypothetical protein [Paludibacter sp.]|uniref:hypothetical protein n=1 Tax=Paludibacter sp. TaxID=1898105 RepID=UPI001355B249|nr:hypothetical protein [Paludibacter sp.]MTK51905.1 hypothetical protein [Paludibacter sp.]